MHPGGFRQTSEGCSEATHSLIDLLISRDYVPKEPGELKLHRIRTRTRGGTPKDNIGATPSGISGNVHGSTSGGAPEVNVETPFVEATPSAREQIEGHLSALRSLLKEHNGRGNVSPIRLSFDDTEDRTRARAVVTGKQVRDADLKRPFKEAVKTLLTRRIIEFTGPE
ncbi:hypothetical protein Tco_0030557, partial [Tanacetum coccineum]